MGKDVQKGSPNPAEADRNSTHSGLVTGRQEGRGREGPEPNALERRELSGAQHGRRGDKVSPLGTTPKQQKHKSAGASDRDVNKITKPIQTWRRTAKDPLGRGQARSKGDLKPSGARPVERKDNQSEATSKNDGKIRSQTHSAENTRERERKKRHEGGTQKAAVRRREARRGHPYARREDRRRGTREREASRREQRNAGESESEGEDQQQQNTQAAARQQPKAAGSARKGANPKATREEGERGAR